jgi:hypothetical protein
MITQLRRFRERYPAARVASGCIDGLRSDIYSPNPRPPCQVICNNCFRRSGKSVEAFSSEQLACQRRRYSLNWNAPNRWPGP